MSKIKVIVFDLGNVLIPVHIERIRENLEKIDIGLGERFRSRFQNNLDVHDKYERGALSDDEFLNVMMEWTEHKLDKEKFSLIYSDIFSLNTEVVSLLPKLKENYRLILLSNTDYLHKKYGWIKYDFIKYFDKLILSFEAGSRKPEDKIYLAVEEFTKEKPEHHLFIDDLELNIKKAIDLGWDGIIFENFEKLISELSLRKIL